MFDTEQDHKDNKAWPFIPNDVTFLKGDKAVETGDRDFLIPKDQRLSLRLIPSKPADSIKTNESFTSRFPQNNLKPMSIMPADERRYRYSWTSEHGHSLAFEENGVILHFTQLFLNGELFGFDSEQIAKERRMKTAGVGFGFIQSKAFEEIFEKTLDNYLKFAEHFLHLSLPLKFIADVTGILNYRMCVSNDFPGIFSINNITEKGYIEDYSAKASVHLQPFSDLVWKECGLKRTVRL